MQLGDPYFLSLPRNKLGNLMKKIKIFSLFCVFGYAGNRLS